MLPLIMSTADIRKLLREVLAPYIQGIPEEDVKFPNEEADNRIKLLIRKDYIPQRDENGSFVEYKASIIIYEDAINYPEFEECIHRAVKLVIDMYHKNRLPIEIVSKEAKKIIIIHNSCSVEYNL